MTYVFFYRIKQFKCSLTYKIEKNIHFVENIFKYIFIKGYDHLVFSLYLPYMTVLGILIINM